MDALGDRMKLYEGFETNRVAMPSLPVVIRIDGKGFSRWTKGLQRPFDERLEQLRRITTMRLMKEMSALVGYTQSDEISLILWASNPKQMLYCGGKLQKLVSHAASIATATFNASVASIIPEKAGTPAMFDARAWTVPSPEEAVNAILWREQDASKNSISQACRTVYSHKDMLDKTGPEMQEMLFQKGINWNNYPTWAKRGTYISRRLINRPYTPQEIETLPPLHKARENPFLTITRSSISVLDIPPLSTIPNRVGVLLFGEDPK